MILYIITFIEMFSIFILNGFTLYEKNINTINNVSLSKFNNEFQPIMLWKGYVKKNINNSYFNLNIINQDNIMFIASYDGIVQAIDLDNGNKIWSIDLSTKINILERKSAQLSSGISINNNKIYIGSELSKLYAIDIKNGNILWKSDVLGEAISYPVISNKIILIHTSNGMLQAFNEENGSLRWTIDLGTPNLTLRGESSPTIILDYCVICDDNDQIRLISINDGKIIWKNEIPFIEKKENNINIKGIKIEPIIFNNIVYVINCNGDLLTFDLQFGKVIWFRKINFSKNMKIYNNCIYIFDQHDRILSINLEKNLIVWNKDNFLNKNLTSPVFYNNYIITGDSNGYIYYINTKNGKLISQKKISNNGLLTINISQKNKLIVQTNNGEIYVMKI